jgi:hypothetical protein
MSSTDFSPCLKSFVGLVSELERFEFRDISCDFVISLP